MNTRRILDDRLVRRPGAHGDGLRSSKNRNFMTMQDRVNRLANALQGLGVGQGDKVAVMALNSMEYVEIYYAAAKLGGVFVPLNYRAKREELTYMCNNSGGEGALRQPALLRAGGRHPPGPGDRASTSSASTPRATARRSTTT